MLDVGMPPSANLSIPFPKTLLSVCGTPLHQSVTGEPLSKQSPRPQEGNSSRRPPHFFSHSVLAFQHSSFPPPGVSSSTRAGSSRSHRSAILLFTKPPPTPLTIPGAMGSLGPQTPQQRRKPGFWDSRGCYTSSSPPMEPRLSPCHFGLGSPVPFARSHSPGPLPPVLPVNPSRGFKDDRFTPTPGCTGPDLRSAQLVLATCLSAMVTSSACPT